MSEFGVSHDRADESFEAKARWFQSLTPQQRVTVFTEFMDLIFANQPRIGDTKDAQAIPGRVQVLELPRGDGHGNPQT
jgi:hypothetical protein